MKAIALGVLAIALFAAENIHAQIITSSGATGPGSANFSYDTSNPATGAAYPYWAQFGVNGSDVGPGLMNVMSGASSAVTASAITQSGDSVASRVQSTSGIYFQYDNNSTPGSLSNANGTSPTSSATVMSSPYLQDGATAGEVSVQTGYGSDAPQTGQTLTFTITFNQAIASALLHVVANDYNATSTMNFSFSGGGPSVNIDDPYPPNGSAPTVGPNDNAIYYLGFSNVSAGTVLTVTDTVTSYLGGASNESISGVAFPSLVVETPEPSTYAMMLGGVVVLLGVLRFRARTA